MSGLTQRQQAILDFIGRCVRERGYPPSVREIGEAVGLASSSTVHRHLDQLEAKGFSRRDPSKPRAIEILQPLSDTVPAVSDEAAPVLPSAPSPDTVWAPLLGRVTAGQPITAEQYIEGYFPLPRSWVRGQEVFLLAVRGDSMVGAGILDSDYVVVRRQDWARNGDIVVALTEEDEATVKRFFRESDHIRLQPENPTMPPLRYRTVKILGKVIGVIRALA
ncbi:MAG: transcriptional repressor LexA [Alicyclobacillus sp.]|nr:transcriptional repressor LexA [Alicyclobacillus sp.]